MRGIDEILFSVAFLAVELCTYLFTMNLLFQIPFRKGKRRWAITITVLLVIHIAATVWKDVRFSDALSFATLGVTVIILLQETKRRIIALHFAIYLAYSSFAAMMMTFVAYICGLQEQKLLNNNLVVLLIESVPPVFFAIYYFSHKGKKREYDFTLQIQQIIFMLIGLACIYIVLGTVQIVEKNMERDLFFYFDSIKELITAVCFVFLILILWQGVVVNRQNQMSEKMRLNELFEQMKEEHFKEILAQDETIRRFRHDYRAHMIALKGYCEQGNKEETIHYLNQLLNNSGAFASKSYVGDAGVDAVINHLAERARRENISLTIEGGCKKPEGITSFELCCVFSNVLTNAIEACERLEENAPKWIRLQLQDYHNNIYIGLQNAISTEWLKEDNTWKEDKKNHGLGMGNVRRIVEKYSGKITIMEQEAAYMVEIIL